METQKEYVVRKLNQHVFNHSAIKQETKISRDTLWRIKKGQTSNPSSSTLQVLENYFRAVAD